MFANNNHVNLNVFQRLKKITLKCYSETETMYKNHGGLHEMSE